MLNLLKNYGAHAVAYLVSVLALVSTLPAPVVALLGPNASLIVGGAGILLTAVHQIQVASKSGSTVTTAAKVLPLLFVLGAAMSVLGGCTALTTDLNTPIGQATLQAIAQAAVTTAEQKGVSAAEIQKIAQAGLAADASASTTLTSVEGALNAEFQAFGLPAGDVAALQIIEAALDAAAATQLSGNATYQNVQVTLSAILNAVLVAAGGSSS